MHHMPAGADPVGADAARHAGGKPIHGNHAPPCNDSGERGLVGAEKRLPDARVDAVGADERVAPRLGPIGEAQPYMFAVLAQAAALCTQVDGVGLFPLHRARQHAEEIGPIHGEVRIPVALDRDGTEIEQLPGLAAAPEPHFLAGRLAGERLELLADAQLMKHARAVRSELQSGAHFLQLRRLFVDLDVAAAFQQRERRGKPADPAPGNQNTRPHHLLLSSLRVRDLTHRRWPTLERYLTVPAPARAYLLWCEHLTENLDSCGGNLLVFM